MADPLDGLRVEVGRPAKVRTVYQKKHAVRKAEGTWVLLCSGNPAVRDHGGRFSHLQCTECRNALREEQVNAPIL